MKTLYLECDSGAAGDMICASLADLIGNADEIQADVNSFGLPDTKVKFEKSESCGISGIHMSVICGGRQEGNLEEFHPDKHHLTLPEIEAIINNLKISDKIKTDAINIYNIIAKAESNVHGRSVGEVHFHELGMLDAVADVVTASYLFDKINADKVAVSPINVGGGSVKCAHGILPVPAPAAADILRSVPYYKSDDIKDELCTPTGAAVLKYFADEFTSSPTVNSVAVGYGIGTKKLERLNAVRAFESVFDDTQEVTELICNIDDMTAEELSSACESIFKAGALDVFTTPIFMKKNRQAAMLTVLCRQKDRQTVLESIFKNTTTIGVREHICPRYVLSRESETVATPYGDVKIKRSSGYGSDKVKIEYDSLKQIADKNNMSFLQAEEKVYYFLKNLTKY